MTGMKVKYLGETQYLMLTHFKVYEVLSVEGGWYGIVEDSGEDYLYPSRMFDTVDES